MALSGSVSTNGYEGRYYTVSWSASQSVANNTSTISWTLSCAGGSSSWYAERTLVVSVAGKTVVNKADRVTRYAGTIASGSVTVSHASNGTGSFSISIQAAVYTSSVNCSGSGSFALNTIPRASTMTISANPTLGSSMTFTIKKASSGFTHTITAKVGNTDIGVIGTEKTSATTITWTPPLEHANRVPNGTSVYYAFYLKTYNGSTLLGQNGYPIYAAIPSTVVPSVSLSISDDAGYLDTYGAFIQSKSKIKFSITASGSYNSTISSYRTTFDGQSYTTSEFVIDPITTYGDNKSASVTVTDSRGRTATASQSGINVKAYSLPKIFNLSAKRSDSAGASSSTGEYLNVIFSSQVTDLSYNTPTYTLRYKKTTEAEWTTVTLTKYAGEYSVTNGNYIFAAETSSSYDVEMTVSDGLSVSAPVTTHGDVVSKLFSILNRGLGWAFGKVAELEDTLDVKWATRLRDTLEVDEITTFNSNVYANGGYIYDHYGQPISNGLSLYTGSGDAAIDPDTTLYELILTDKNTTNLGTGGFWYIRTMFYGEKSETANRFQQAFPYSQQSSTYCRYYMNGSWTDWMMQDMLIYADVDGSWNVRKWASGDAEIWRTVSTTTGTSGQAHSTVSFPFNITSNRHASVTFGATGASTAYLQYVKTTASNIDMYGKGTASTACWFDVRVIGKWK